MASVSTCIDTCPSPSLCPIKAYRYFNVMVGDPSSYQLFGPVSTYFSLDESFLGSVITNSVVCAPEDQGSVCRSGATKERNQN
jgi:hypothetical protein